MIEKIKRFLVERPMLIVALNFWPEYIFILVTAVLFWSDLA